MLPGEPSFRIPPPRHMGGHVLYLDFDGTLMPHNVRVRAGRGPYVASPPGHRLFENARLLEDVLMPYPSVKIVLSTSWVRAYRSVHKVARRLPEGLRGRVVGATWHSGMDDDFFRVASRGLQVWADVVRRRPAAWLAIDDDDSGWPAWCCDHLVRTDEVLGISAPVVLAELQEKLQAMFRDEA